jgi:polyisoprenyl-phosphate glycosyltransferase
MSTPPTVSIVLPVYNEEECLPALVERLGTVMAGLAVEYELIFVDGASTDRSYEVLQALAAGDPAVKCLSLSRNSGHQAALSCGLQLACGAVVITMDADLQHPPELIPEMLELWREGFDVVNTRKLGTDRIGFWKSLSSRCFYKVYNLLSEVPITPAASDFRLLDRRCVDAINSMGEHDKFHRALVHYIGFRQTTLEFHCPARFAGKAKFSFPKLLALAADGIFSFSTLPLKLPFYLGVLVLAILGLLFVVAVVLALTGHLELPPGWGYLFTVMVLTFGAQLVFIGIMGLYMARLILEVKKRPHHFVQRAFGFDGEAPAERSPAAAPEIVRLGERGGPTAAGEPRRSVLGQAVGQRSVRVAPEPTAPAPRRRG